MTQDTPEDEERRTFMKGAAATGVAVTGIGLFGTASAQQDIRELNVNLTEQDGLANVDVGNINVLKNVNVQNVEITVIGGDVVDDSIENILNDLDLDVNVDDVVNNVEVLNDSVVQVAVAVLGGSGNLVGAGSDALNL